ASTEQIRSFPRWTEQRRRSRPRRQGAGAFDALSIGYHLVRRATMRERKRGGTGWGTTVACALDRLILCRPVRILGLLFDAALILDSRRLGRTEAGRTRHKRFFRFLASEFSAHQVTARNERKILTNGFGV